MRIVHVSAYFAPAFCYGGPPRSILALCRALARRDVDIDVFTTTANGSTDLPSHPEGVAFDGFRVHYFRRQGPKSVFFAPGLGDAIAQAARHAEVVHIHGLWNATVWAGARAANRAGRPYIVSPRGMLQPDALRHHQMRKRVAYRAFDKRVLAGAALVHATSRVERHTLEALRFGAPIVEVPNIVDEIRDANGAFDVRATLNLLPMAPVVVFLGRIHPIKRIDLLIAAMQRVRDRHPNAELVIAGPDENGHRAALEPLTEVLQGHVHWLGSVDGAAKHALLEQSTVLVMCSDSESFGMSVLDALTAGCPVVVTKTCPWDRIESAGAGFWVDQTAVAVATAVTTLIEVPAVRQRMSDAGRAWSRQEFGADRIVETWLQTYAAVAPTGSKEHRAASAAPAS